MIRVNSTILKSVSILVVMTAVIAVAFSGCEQGYAEVDIGTDEEVQQPKSKIDGLIEKDKLLPLTYIIPGTNAYIKCPVYQSGTKLASKVLVINDNEAIFIGSAYESVDSIDDAEEALQLDLKFTLEKYMQCSFSNYSGGHGNSTEISIDDNKYKALKFRGEFEKVDENTVNDTDSDVIESKGDSELAGVVDEESIKDVEKDSESDDINTDDISGVNKSIEVYGYMVSINGVPCQIVGIVTNDIRDSKYMNEITYFIDEMIKTLTFSSNKNEEAVKTEDSKEVE